MQGKEKEKEEAVEQMRGEEQDEGQKEPFRWSMTTAVDAFG